MISKIAFLFLYAFSSTASIITDQEKLIRINNYINEHYLANPIVKIINELTQETNGKNGCVLILYFFC